MMSMMKKHNCAMWGMMILRVVLGVGFLLHGIQKLGMMDGVTGFFGSLGLPVVIAWAVAIGETVAGAMLILGLWTKVAGYAVAVIMLGAMIIMKMKGGYMAHELEVIYLAAGLAIAWGGPGCWALAHAMKKGKKICDNCHECTGGACTSHE